MRELLLSLAATTTLVLRASATEPSTHRDGGDSLAAPLELKSFAKLPPGPARENSGIVQSRLSPDLYWMENDSGDEPRVYAIHRDGSAYAAERDDDKPPGTLVGGAINVDWEDITVDDRGHLVVADLGNNGNNRRDLALYFLAEPAPTAERTTFVRRIFVHYPDQKTFPAPKEDFNYDAEAVFSIGSKIYILSKHRSDTATKLYRYDPDAPSTGESVPLELVDRFEIDGQPTSAEATPDGRRLVVSTYTSFWLFDVVDPDQPLRGPVSRLDFTGPTEIEAVCFAEGDALLAGDELTGTLFEIPLSAFPKPTARTARR